VKKPRIPSYRLHRASGQAIVTLSGRDHYLGVHGTAESHAEYERLVAEWLAGGRGAVPDRSPDATVSEVLAAYWAWAQEYYRKHGEQTSQVERVRRSLMPAQALYGASPAREFGPVKLKACRARLVQDGLSRPYVNSLVGCLRRAWKWAASEELVPAEVYHGLLSVSGLKLGRTEAREPAPILPVDPALVEQTLPFLTGELRACVRFLQLVGCRPGEALSLRACDLDRSGVVWLYRPATWKTEHHGRGRVIPVGPRAQEVLQAQLREGEDQSYHLFDPRRAMAEFRVRQRAARKSKVQPSQRDRSKPGKKLKAPGERYDDRALGRAIDLVCRREGIPAWHPNQLRHSHATAVRARYGLEAAQAVLGHAEASVTQIYAERDLSLASKVAAEMG